MKAKEIDAAEINRRRMVHTALRDLGKASSAEIHSKARLAEENADLGSVFDVTMILRTFFQNGFCGMEKTKYGRTVWKAGQKTPSDEDYATLRFNNFMRGKKRGAYKKCPLSDKEIIDQCASVTTDAYCGATIQQVGPGHMIVRFF